MDNKAPFWWPEMQTIIVSTLMALFALTILLLLLRPINITGEAGTLLTALIAILTGKIATIVDFYFGTSKSNKSSENTDVATISKLENKVEVTATETTKGN